MFHLHKDNALVSGWIDRLKTAARQENSYSHCNPNAVGRFSISGRITNFRKSILSTPAERLPIVLTKLFYHICSTSTVARSMLYRNPARLAHSLPTAPRIDILGNLRCQLRVSIPSTSNSLPLILSNPARLEHTSHSRPSKSSAPARRRLPNTARFF